MYPGTSVIVLLAVLLMIAFRQVGGLRLQIWQAMLLGALAVLATGQISVEDAILAVNLDVMLFLFGMFVVGVALQESGYLLYLSHRLFRRAKNADQLILLILFCMGGLSAVLMNDTLAIVGTPLVLQFARAHGISPKLMLLTLAHAVTTGSVLSPMGNPQNLLIALSKEVPEPFVTFFVHLALPTAVNLLAAYAVLRLAYGDQFKNGPLNHNQEAITDPELASISRASLAVLGLMILAKVAAVLLGLGVEIRLTYVALAAALPVLALSRRRQEVVRKVDWHTLIFFAAMFVLMESVWDTGLFQDLLARTDMDPSSLPVILGLSVSLSQVISNVPFVALYLPLIANQGATVTEMLALAAGSTIAGNLTILGAASNVIIIQSAERQGETLTFGDFARVGLPLTAINVVVYWAFLELL